jgi:threonine synthase
MKARIFVPESASGPKRQQIAAYGAEIHAIQGPRSIAAQAVREAANKGIAYASHAYLPYGLAGYATIAYEIVEQLGQAPGSVIVPAGMGNLILAVGRGFEALKVNGVIDTRPALIGVQARACAPIWAAFHYGQAGLGWVTEGETLAEGVRVRNPLRGDAVIAMVESSGGTFIAVDEEEIISARDELATRGFYVEPTSAIVWKAAEQVAGQTPDPIVAILTGSGLKARN